MALKILVVDDEPYMHRLLQHHFNRAGYSMISANNGREAIAMAASEKPDLVVMDVMMADMDGLTALKQLKKDDATKNIPVIMITANAHHITRQESEVSGATLFLTKPFSPTQLLVEIKRLVPEAEKS
jgi:two-component system alkaline phosphatase synthesis response regulator PhoP